MNNILTSIKPFITINHIKFLFSGLIILFLYFIFVYFSFFSLTAHQLKLQLEGLTLNNTHGSPKDIYIKHTCNLSNIEKFIIAKDGIAENVPCIRIKVDESERLNSAIYILDNYESLIKDYDETIEKSINHLAKNNIELDTNNSLTSEQKRNIEGNKTGARNKISEYIEKKNSLRKKKTIIQKTLKIDIYDGFFSPLMNIIGINNHWSLPNLWLSLMLSLSMGGLGSLITLTIEYLKIQNITSDNIMISMFIFRPLLGTIMAVVMFIGIKSGQLSISGDIVTDLSPFLLSFIGIMCGLMSENVYYKLTKMTI